MHATHLLTEFASRAGFPSLAFSSDHTARLVIDGKFNLEIEHEDARGLLHLYTSLGPPPVEDRTAWWERLLVASYFGRETGRATPCLDPVKHEVLLVRTLDLDTVTPAAFEHALQALVDAHERLTLALAPGVIRPTNQEPAFDRFDAGFMRA